MLCRALETHGGTRWTVGGTCRRVLRRGAQSEVSEQRARDVSRTTTRSAERTVAKRSANDRQRKAMERRCRAPRAKRGCRPGSCGGAKGLEAHQHKQWQRSSVRQHLVPTRRQSGHRGSHVGEYAGLLCANQPLASHLDGGIDSTLVLALGCRPAICAGGAVMSWTQSIRAAGGRRGLHFTLKPRREAREAARKTRKYARGAVPVRKDTVSKRSR